MHKCVSRFRKARVCESPHRSTACVLGAHLKSACVIAMCTLLGPNMALQAPPGMNDGAPPPVTTIGLVARDVNGQVKIFDIDTNEEVCRFLSSTPPHTHTHPPTHPHTHTKRSLTAMPVAPVLPCAQQCFPSCGGASCGGDPPRAHAHLPRYKTLRPIRSASRRSWQTAPPRRPGHKPRSSATLAPPYGRWPVLECRLGPAFVPMHGLAAEACLALPCGCAGSVACRWVLFAC